MHFFNSSRRCCASIVWIKTNECLINTVLSSPDGTRSSEKTTPSVKTLGYSQGKALNRNVKRPALRDDERKALHRDIRARKATPKQNALTAGRRATASVRSSPPFWRYRLWIHRILRCESPLSRKRDHEAKEVAAQVENLRIGVGIGRFLKARRKACPVAVT